MNVIYFMKKIFALSLPILLLMTSSALSEIYSKGEALAVFRISEGESVSAASLNVSAAVAELDAGISETYEALSEIGGKLFVLVRSSTKTTEQLISELKARPDVITASPNYYTQRLTFSSSETKIPNDPSADLCWGLEAIKAPEVWSSTTGSTDIYACVVDTGIYKHPDLEANLASELGLNTKTVSGEFDLYFTSWDSDLVGHGTHVAGTIGAVGNNNIGVAGVNWNVGIIPIRVFDKEYDFESINYEIRAMNYIANLLKKNPEMKIAAVNFSLGAALPVTPSEMKEDVYYMAYQALDSLNRTLIIAGAGNSRFNIGVPMPFDDMYDIYNRNKKGSYFYPASFIDLNNFIVVGAIDSDDTAAYFTNWGESVDIAAPGVKILSTYSPLSVTAITPPMYASLSGTSMAVPHVTGAAALLMSAFPDATPAQIKLALLEGADPDKNPLVYPYAYNVKREVEDLIDFIDMRIEAGQLSPASRDSEIARVTRATEEKYAPYKVFDGTGRVSRTGLLDVKAAYDILSKDIFEAKTKKTVGGSSGGGCNSGGVIIMLSVIGLWAFIRVKLKEEKFL
ncbi:MAG: S8 family serine peptidase [Synergistaceae bacterium]|nr:S8 family serine peptidase [Synergistaceae bacterium]